MHGRARPPTLQRTSHNKYLLVTPLPHTKVAATTSATTPFTPMATQNASTADTCARRTQKRCTTWLQKCRCVPRYSNRHTGSHACIREHQPLVATTCVTSTRLARDTTADHKASGPAGLTSPAFVAATTCGTTQLANAHPAPEVDTPDTHTLAATSGTGAKMATSLMHTDTVITLRGSAPASIFAALLGLEATRVHNQCVATTNREQHEDSS